MKNKKEYNRLTVRKHREMMKKRGFIMAWVHISMIGEVEERNKKILGKLS